MQRKAMWPMALKVIVAPLVALVLVAASCGASLAEEKATAAPSGPLTLNQAIDMALDYSPTLAQTREDLQKAHQTLWQAKTGYLPKLDTAYNWQRTQNPSVIDTPLGSFVTSSENTYVWTTSLTQPLFTGFRITSGYKMADLGVDMARLDVELNILDLVVSVKQAYILYLTAQKNHEVAVQAVTQLQSHLQTARDFNEVGILPINDVLKVEVELSNAQQEEVKTANYVALSLASLNTLLGLPVDGQLEVEDILPYKPLKLDYDDARNQARANRPELKSIKLGIEQANWNVTKAKSEYYPQVSVKGAYDMTSDEAGLGDSPYYDQSNWTVAAGASLNVFQWGATAAEVNKARADVRRAEMALKGLRDQVDLQVKEAYLYLKESEKNIQTSQVAVKQAEENYRITMERYREQLTTNTELLDAQTLLTKAQNNYFNSLGVFNTAKAQLLRAMGAGLDPEKLAKRAADKSASVTP